MIETWRDIPGFFDFQDIYDQAVAEAGNGDLLVEVGTYLGKSAAYMADRIKDSGKRLSFLCVDTWDPVAYAQWWRYTDDPPSPWPVGELIGMPLYEAFKKCMRDTGSLVAPIRESSTLVACEVTGSYFPFVFLDASHLYHHIKADIAAWLPKVRKGGILAGHDYAVPRWPGVKQAVDEAFGNRVEHRGNSWVVRI